MNTMNLPIENKRNAAQLIEMKWLMKRNPTAIYHNYKTLHYFLYESMVPGTMKPMMTWFWGDSKKVAGNFYYPNESQRTESLEGLMKSADLHESHKAATKAKRSGSVNVKVGDVFVDSWGYEQTNIDFYQVVELVGKSTVVVREIGGETVGEPTSYCSDVVRPVKDSFLLDSEGNYKEYRKRVTRWGNGEKDYSIKTSSFSSARPTSYDSTHHRSWGY